MATNLDIDDALIVRAKKAGKHKTKKETVKRFRILLQPLPFQRDSWITYRFFNLCHSIAQKNSPLYNG